MADKGIVSSIIGKPKYYAHVMAEDDRRNKESARRESAVSDEMSVNEDKRRRKDIGCYCGICWHMEKDLVFRGDG